MIYQIVFIMLLIFILRYDINGKTRYRNECYFVMLVIFILIAGLRYRLGIDTTRYLTRFYYETPQLQNLTWSDLEFGTDPLYTLLNSVVLTLGGKFYDVQLIHATFVNTLLFTYFKKHSHYIFICIFFYFIWLYCLMNMEEMRASMSLVVCLFANDYILEKKWVKGILLYIIGCLFHVSTLLVMLMPLFFFLRFNKIGVSVLVAAFIGGMIIRPYIEDYLMIMELNDALRNKAERYVNSDRMMERSLNIFGYLVRFIIYGYSVYSLFLIKQNKGDRRLLKFEPLLMIYLVMALLSLNVVIAYRFARFYAIYYILFVSEIPICLIQQKSRLSYRAKCARTFVIVFPLFFLIIIGRLSEKTWVRYHPYSSVIDKEIDMKRERVYTDFKADRPVEGKY